MKKTPVKKALCGIVAAAVTVVGFSACGQSSTNSANVLTNVSFPLKKSVTLNFVTHAPSISTQDPNQKLITQRIEKATNVHINWTCYVDDQFGDKKQLLLAKRNLPDAIFDAQMSQYDLLRYAKQKVIVPVDDLIKKYMPNLTQILSENPQYRTAITAPDGHIYSFPWIEELGTGKEAIQAVDDIPWINKKWLDELGLPVPSTTQELENALLAFKQKKPGGQSNILPMSFMINHGGEDPSELLGSFGLGDNDDHYLVTNDKKVVYSLSQDGYKNGVNWLHKLQSEGLIDPEAYTQTWDTYVSKGQSGRYGLFFTWDDSNIVNDPQDYVPLPPLKGPDGTINVTRTNGAGLEVGRMVVTSSDANLELTAKWVDQLYAPLQSVQDNWGTYGDTKNGNIFELTAQNTLKHLPIPSGTSPYELRVKTNIGGPLAVLNSYYGKYTTKPDDAAARLDILHKVYEPYMSADYNYPQVFMGMDDINKLTQIETSLKTYAEQKKADFILNGNVDAQWSDYLKQLDAKGLKDALAIKQKGFDSYYASNK